MFTQHKGIIDMLCALALALLLILSAQPLQADEPTQAMPDASTKAIEPTQATPDVSAKATEPTLVTPDASANTTEPTQATSDVSANTTEPTQATPDASAITTDSAPPVATDTTTAEAGDATDDELPICDVASIQAGLDTSGYNEAQIKRIQQQLQYAGYQPQYVDGIVGPETLNALAQLCTDFQVETTGNIAVELNERLQAMARIYPSGWQVLVEGEVFKQWQAQKAPKPMVPKLEPLQLTGGGCGCSREFKAKVYGFYPYWLASTEPQQLDFSLYDRISYFKLEIDSNGDFSKPLHWDDKYHIADFINLAHKHRVKVDLTLQTSGWRDWSPQMEDNAVFNIAGMATQTYHATDTQWLRKLLPLVEDDSSVRADGVTLFFDDYARYADSARLADIVDRVADRLEQSSAATSLNVMLRLDWSQIDDLLHELPAQPLDKICRPLATPTIECMIVDDRIEYVLVYLTQDTSTSKKQLRQAIENAYHGDTRRIALEKILPIIPPPDDAEKTVQFEDDLIYFEYNFGGVALWPIPLADTDSDAAELLDQSLLKLYPDTANVSPMVTNIESYAPWLCQFTCPNRWLFRITFDLLAGLLMLYIVFVVLNCSMRELYQRYFVHFVIACLLTATILLVSLVCDPFWREWAEYVVIGLLLFLIIGIIWRYVRKAMQPRLP